MFRFELSIEDIIISPIIDHDRFNNDRLKQQLFSKRDFFPSTAIDIIKQCDPLECYKLVSHQQVVQATSTWSQDVHTRWRTY